MKYLAYITVLLVSFLAFSESAPTMDFIEICDNGLDDDGDGLIDLNDGDCECEFKMPESLVPNPSFEDQDCCPGGRSELACATDWIQASQPTTDYIHTCGFKGWDGIPTPLPYPAGDGLVGFRDGRNIMGVKEANWKEYAGACLLSPLKKDVEYVFQFYLGFVDFRISPPIDFTFFGTKTCDDLPFGSDDILTGCPTNDADTEWQFLKSVRVEGKGWVLTTITIVPDEDIYAVAIGPPCAQTTSQENLYYFLDDLILAESKSFSKTVVESENPCDDSFILSVDENFDATYQWYLNGIALVGETSYLVRPELTQGNYAVMEMVDGNCNLSNTYNYQLPVEYTMVQETICKDTEIEFAATMIGENGIYFDTLSTFLGCDSIVELDLRVLGEIVDTVSEKIFEGDVLELGNFDFSEQGSYNIILESIQGCDSLVLLDLELYKVYIPNVFSPNEDGINDLFEVFIEDPEVNINGLSIFDQWGNRVYYRSGSNNDQQLFWDGRLFSQSPKPGIYIYIIEFLLEGKPNKMVSGEFALLL